MQDTIALPIRCPNGHVGARGRVAISGTAETEGSPPELQIIEAANVTGIGVVDLRCETCNTPLNTNAGG